LSSSARCCSWVTAMFLIFPWFGDHDPAVRGPGTNQSTTGPAQSRSAGSELPLRGYVARAANIFRGVPDCVNDRNENPLPPPGQAEPSPVAGSAWHVDASDGRKFTTLAAVEVPGTGTPCGVSSTNVGD